jgi:hypothetical protein
MPVIVQIIIVLAVVGVVVYLFNTFVTMDGRFKNAINALVGLAVFLWILDTLFGWGWFGSLSPSHAAPLVKKGC